MPATQIPYSCGHTRTFDYKCIPLFWAYLSFKFSVMLWENTFGYTVFRRINAPSAEAENESLALSDLNESRRVYTEYLDFMY